MACCEVLLQYVSGRSVQTKTKQQWGQSVCLLDFKPKAIKQWQGNKNKAPNILVFWMKRVWRPDILASCMGYSTFECQSKNKLFLLMCAVPPEKCSSMRQILSYYFKIDHLYFFHILPIQISNLFYGSATSNQ